MSESCVVFLAKQVFELESENMLLRARLEDFPMAEPNELERKKLLFKRREIALFGAKLKYEEEQKAIAAERLNNQSSVDIEENVVENTRMSAKSGNLNLAEKKDDRNMMFEGPLEATRRQYEQQDVNMNVLGEHQIGPTDEDNTRRRSISLEEQNAVESMRVPRKMDIVFNRFSKARHGRKEYKYSDATPTSRILFNIDGRRRNVDDNDVGCDCNGCDDGLDELDY